MAGLKYRSAAGGLEVDTAQVDPGSVLIARRVAAFYRAVLPGAVRGTLADLGCGTSPLRGFYTPLVDRAVAIDWPRSLHDGPLDAAADLNDGIPLRSASTDVVLLSDVLEHLTRPDQALAEARRVLRPGGTLVGNVPFMYWLHEEPYDYFRYTEHGLRHLLAEAGFATVDITVLAGGVDVLVDVLGKLLRSLPLFGRPMARLAQSGWAGLTAIGAVRRLSRRLERRLPLAYGFVASP